MNRLLSKMSSLALLLTPVLLAVPCKAEKDSILKMLPLASVASAEGDKGLTWRKMDVNSSYGDGISGVVHVGCSYEGVDCDPYNGDTTCNTELPLLCFYDANLPKPTTLILPVPNPNQYHEWSGGIVATTMPVSGSSFTTIADANARCVMDFGTGWRVAEFHDGWGWYFFAYGNVGENYAPSYRFWIDINNQPDGTCWAH